jgi:hypothetical protein
MSPKNKDRLALSAFLTFVALMVAGLFWFITDTRGPTYVRDCVRSEIVALVIDPTKGTSLCVEYGPWRKE